jgi:glycosyltransferase 2 family protein
LKLDWRGALGIAVSAALLWWVLHGIPFHEVSATLRGANLPLFLLSSAVATVVFPLRARRWRPILDPIAPNLPFGMLWRSVAIGFMVNNVVPARAGELARAFALTRESATPSAVAAGIPRVPFTASLASLAVDRLFDAFVVLLLALLAIFAPEFPGGTRISGVPATRWASVGILGMMALAAVLYAIVFFPGWLIGAYEVISRRVAPSLEVRGREMLLHFSAGLRVLRNPVRFVTILLWAIALWLTNALSFWIGFQAVGIHVPWTAALFLQALIAIGVAVPAAPGFFGIFEVLATIGLGVYGVPKELAVSWAIGYHILSFIPITVIGAWYFARLGMHLSEVQVAEQA